VRTKTAKYYLAAALLSLALWVARKRAYGYDQPGAIAGFFFVYRWLPMRQFLVITVKFCFIAIVVIGIAYVTSPTFLTQRTAAFSDAFRVTVSASEVDNPSANVRLLEVLTAIPYIEKNPLLGNGRSAPVAGRRARGARRLLLPRRHRIGRWGVRVRSIWYDSDGLPVLVRFARGAGVPSSLMSH